MLFSRRAIVETLMPWHELHRARTRTQHELAQMLKVNQPAFSNLEWRTDMYI